jgi:putative membrane protein
MNDRLAKMLIFFVSSVIFIVVTMLFYLNPTDIDLGFDLKVFPRFHAILNSITAICLVAAFIFIKMKKIQAHRYSMITAFILSVVFLISYVFYHSVSSPTKYGGEGLLRYIYYFTLISHIFLAAVVLPFILFTFYRALNKQFVQHKKIARWTFPMWLYVAITGVLVYILISPYYV